MLKKDITYVDWDGNQRTETHYFNITKAELVQLENSIDGSFSELLQRIVKKNSGRDIMETFMKILELSYGIKSDDGRRFIKNPSYFQEFKETPAFDELFMSLCTDANFSAKFIQQVLPQDLPSDKPQGVPPSQFNPKGIPPVQGFQTVPFNPQFASNQPKVANPSPIPSQPQQHTPQSEEGYISRPPHEGTYGYTPDSL